MAEIKENIALASYTTFRLGGPARFFVEAATEDDVRQAMAFAKERHLKVFAIGGGSNLLVSDGGFDGLVIRIANNECRNEGNALILGAGLPLSDAVKAAVSSGLAGLEWAAGIPGTVGGAVYGNAGAYEGSMGQKIESVEALAFDLSDPYAVEKKTYSNAECGFEYRNSLFKKSDPGIIFSARLVLDSGDREAMEKRVRETIEKRRNIHPSGFSAGSVFQNPVVKDKDLVDRFERDTGAKARDGKIPAGWLIMEAGLRGKKVGGVEVSEKHSNFIVNGGAGKAEHVVILTSLIKQKIREKFGIQLKEEIRYVGF